MLRKMISGAVLIAFGATANAAPILEEGFENLAGLAGAGWLFVNASTNPGTSWEQGNSGIFPADAGGADSYAAASFLNASETTGGPVDNWMITPLFSGLGESVISFSTRTAGNIIGTNTDTGDNLEVLFNNVGTLALTDFVSLGLITSASFPTSWQAFNFTYGGPYADVRFAFRYTVSDALLTGDYIGVDSVSVSVPEPGTMILLGSGLLLTPLAMRRRRRERA